MKKSIFIITFLFVSICFAQRSNSDRLPEPNTNKTRTERPKFEAKKVSGIFEYNSKKALKKLKLKSKDSSAISTKASIENYNSKMEAITLANKDLFEGLDIIVNQSMEAAMSSGNREGIKNTMMMVREKLEPIRNKIKAEETKLNKDLESTLNPVNYSSWLDFQKSVKAKLNPARPRSQNRAGRQGSRPPRGGRGR